MSPNILQLILIGFSIQRRTVLYVGQINANRRPSQLLPSLELGYSGENRQMKGAISNTERLTVIELFKQLLVVLRKNICDD